jgi:hypothetical protein
VPFDWWGADSALSSAGAAAGWTHPFFPVREVSEAELLAVLRIPNTADQAG